MKQPRTIFGWGAVAVAALAAVACGAPANDSSDEASQNLSISVPDEVVPEPASVAIDPNPVPWHGPAITAVARDPNPVPWNPGPEAPAGDSKNDTKK